ncbi:outer membrane beta-barrel domain-containing protein [Bdellovibrio bacteriovorus]|uniref:Outer membrane beta-barrel domain-containing protein n=1 Tax=Bdellovibrio bacteriovorus TaxID=959 RepID=A0A1Z3NAZ9_BDEBC|nr:outer membrane beta-barrel domain-containing protein [Bdellovibrio bacteriovorus]ASD64663.1 outer membrane beta-barrel domain-containing protein [Bdellovibrio bacteriovorus]
MLSRKLTSLVIVSLALLVPGLGHAQSEGDELDVIELELEKEAPRQQPSISDSTPSYQETAPKDNTLTDFSGLGTLAPFQEISIIQKRFLPKTGRFQLFGGLTTVTNDPFFLTFGGVAKASYFMSESWGLELNYFGLTTSNRQATDELREINGVSTENLVYPKSFIGVDLMYVPVYGKMTWFNETIVPFDLYLSAGYGNTETQSGESAGTVHLAAGQIFALSKAYAVRWDFSWNFFNAKGIDGSTNSFNNLFLTVGMSWFFPEASYR